MSKEREKSVAYQTEAELHKKYSNDVVAELTHLEQKTVNELNDKLTAMQTQLKASESNLLEKSRAFNIARSTIADLKNELESLKCNLNCVYVYMDPLTPTVRFS